MKGRVSCDRVWFPRGRRYSESVQGTGYREEGEKRKYLEDLKESEEIPLEEVFEGPEDVVGVGRLGVRKLRLITQVPVPVSEDRQYESVPLFNGQRDMGGKRT